MEKRLENSINKTIQMMKNLYSYLNVINMDGIFDILKFSPGMEEYSVILALEDIFKHHSKMDFIIFDTPPTGLALRFFALPGLSLLWVEKLLQLRKKILSRRASLKNIIGDKLEESKLPSSDSEDSVFKELVKYEVRLNTLKKHLTSKEHTFISLLLNPDKLSFAEGLKIIKTFEKFTMPINMVIINKRGLYKEEASKESSLYRDNFFKELNKKFHGFKTVELPFKESGTISKNDMLDFGKNILKNL